MTNINLSAYLTTASTRLMYNKLIEPTPHFAYITSLTRLGIINVVVIIIDMMTTCWHYVPVLPNVVFVVDTHYHFSKVQHVLHRLKPFISVPYSSTHLCSINKSLAYTQSVLMFANTN